MRHSENILLKKVNFRIPQSSLKLVSKRNDVLNQSLLLYFVFRVLSFWGLILGLFLLLTMRISYVSVNPIWSDVTSNRVVLLVAALATLDRVYTGYMMSISQSGSQSKSLSEPQDSKLSGPGWLLVAVGFGALMFLTHAVFGEVSLVFRWAVSGYPHTGPKPNPWGSVQDFICHVKNVLSFDAI